MARALVTGGSGFLGSHLCDRLIAAGEEVICVDNFFTGSRQNVAHLLGHPGFELVRHDIVEPLSVEVQSIYHLACPASPIHYQKNPVKTIRTAVQGTLNMLDLARDIGARILIASTSEVYGDPLQHPQREDYWGNVNPIGPRSCYDEGKRCAESLTVAYASQYGVDARIARIFNTYGPRMHSSDGRVVSNFIMQALQNQSITLYGDGGQTRSFCYADDTISALMTMMNLRHDPGPINIGNPREQTILELAQTIIRLAGSSSELSYEPLPTDDPNRRKPDVTKAHELLQWAPRVSVEEGLQETIRYFRERLARHHRSQLRAGAEAESLAWPMVESWGSQT